MSSFLGTGTTVHAAIWSVIQALALATVVVFTGARLGPGQGQKVADAARHRGSVVGMVVLFLWWSAVSSIGGVTNVVTNLALHAARIAVILLVLLIPSLARRLDRLLAAYPAGPA
jgi:hypothetical protein